MTRLTVVDKNAERNAEEQLWSQYLVAELTCQRIQMQYEKAWRLYVMCDDMVTRSQWSALSGKWKDVREHAEAARRAWKVVAYPLYGWPLDEDEKSS